LQHIDATGASVSSLTNFAYALVVNKSGVIAGTELAVELPSYRPAESCHNFRLQLSLCEKHTPAVLVRQVPVDKM